MLGCNTLKIFLLLLNHIPTNIAPNESSEITSQKPKKNVKN
ncbi:hypothetical protein DYY67_1259 [Candidatus Nitrosotalea sp. TS]|nr:hypothetical protein [Candidatus Nitrosotalea sp. TS]